MQVAVEVCNLSKRFGPILAVDDVSFNVTRGEVLGFLGPNGAGKSTTMKIITGFLAPDSGRVSVAGLDIANDPVRVKHMLGYLPEGAPLYGDMTAAAALAFVADIRALRGATRHRRLDETIAKLHLETVLEQPVDTLSKGFKRRLALAQAIMHDPAVLVLDEPTDGLDPNQKHEVRTLIREMARDKVIVLSTHILEEVDAVCTRAVIISHGRLVADGSPQELAARSPMHDAITLGVSDAAGEEAGTLLRGLAAVRDVTVLEDADGAVRLRVLPHASPAPVVEVTEAVSARGWRVTELHVERGRLDDVFRDMTSGTDAREDAA